MAGHKGQVVGYVRVSAADQNEARQFEALGAVDKMFSEKVSGKNVQLKAKGVALEFVDNPALNSDTPQGEFMLTILAAIAQLERKTIRERQAEGIVIAKRDGKYEKAPKLALEQITEARKRVDAGVPKALVARDLGVSRQTLYAALNGSGKYAALAGA